MIAAPRLAEPRESARAAVLGAKAATKSLSNYE